MLSVPPRFVLGLLCPKPVAVPRFPSVGCSRHPGSRGILGAAPHQPRFPGAGGAERWDAPGWPHRAGERGGTGVVPIGDGTYSGWQL